MVRDGLDGSPLVGATVWTAGAPHWTLTDERGRFSSSELYPGQHLVQFSYLGYVTRADTIRVEYGRLTNVRVSLSVDPVELDPIEVSVEKRQAVLQDEGFYERESKGFGRFLVREDIEKRAPGKMSDLFAGLPGVTLVRDPRTGQRYVMLGGGRFTDCFPRVVLDNRIVGAGGDQPAQIDMLLSRDVVAGVEVYTRSAGVPMRYGGTGSACGVIMIWTGR